jgi:hypothetical protein
VFVKAGEEKVFWPHKNLQLNFRTWIIFLNPRPHWNKQSLSEERLEDITGITCIYVPVNDVYESIKWYQKNLGYQHANNDRVEPGMVMAVLNFPDRNGNLPHLV